MKFNKLIPELSVKNLVRSLKFYQELGFKIEYERKENKFAFLSFEGSQIMIQEINGIWETGKLEYPLGRGINFQIEVKDITPILETLKVNNIKFFQEVRENWYRQDKKILGNREFLVQDPDGYLLRFFQDIGKK
jgi:predicted enzyme related to lactoylglutathione lyase